MQVNSINSVSMQSRSRIKKFFGIYPQTPKMREYSEGYFMSKEYREKGTLKGMFKNLINCIKTINK